MRENGKKFLNKSDLGGAEADVDLGMGDLGALLLGSLSDLWVAVTEVADTDSARRYEGTKVREGGDPGVSG